MANNPTKFVMKQKVNNDFIQLLPKTVIDQIWASVSSAGVNSGSLWEYLNNRVTSITADSDNLNNQNFVNITVATETNSDGHTKVVTLDPSLQTVAMSSASSSNDGLPTAYDLKNYIGSFAGGITYIGKLGHTAGHDYIEELPTTGVNTGDLYIVAEAGTYGSITANVGDLIIAKVNGSDGAISWQHVELIVDVVNEAANVPVTIGSSSKTQIATVDGKPITMSVTATANAVSRSATTGAGGIIATTVEGALTEIATEIDDMVSSYNVGSNVAVHLKQESGTVSSFSVTEKYATVTSSKTGNSDTAITVTNSNQLLKGKDAATLATFTNTRIGEEIAKLDADITSSEAAVAKVQVVESNGIITDVVVTNISANVTATTTEGANPSISASTTTGAVTGADIATIKGYVDARSKYDINQLDVPEYAQATIANTSSSSVEGGSISVKSIKEVDGKISEGTSVVTLTAETGLRIYDGKIGHTNSVTEQTDGLGSVGTGTSSTAPVTNVLTGVKYDAQGHITAATETALTDVNIPVNGTITNLSANNVHAALAELQHDIDSCISGTQFKGEFNDTDKPFPSIGKTGDQWIYNGTESPITIKGKRVEKGDMVIVSDVTNPDPVTKEGTINGVVVIERSLDKAVTNTSDALTTDKIVLGAGNDTVKTSTYGVSTSAIGAAGTGNDTDILTSKAVVDTIANKISNLDATVTSDSTNVNVSVTETDGILTAITVSEDYATVATGTSSTGDTTITVSSETGLVIGTDIATVADFVNTRISEEISKLDATVAQIASDGNGSLALQIVETDGKLTSVTGSVKTATDDNYGVVKVAGINSGSSSLVAQNSEGKLTVGNAALTVTRAADGNSSAETANSFTADARTPKNYTFHASYTVVSSTESEDLQNGDFWFDTSEDA